MLEKIQSKSVKSRIEAIKACTKILEQEDAENKAGLEIQKLSDKQINDLKDYPEDYRLFLSEIGSLDLSPGYCALQIIPPQFPPVDLDFDEEGASYSGIGYGIYWGFDPTIFKTHVPVACKTCEYISVGYDISEKPFKFTDFSDFCMQENFLELVEEEFYQNPWTEDAFWKVHEENK